MYDDAGLGEQEEGRTGAVIMIYGRKIVSAFIFDMDDTLYDQLYPFKKAYDTLFGSRFQVDIRALFEARTARADETFELAVKGKITMEEMHIYRIQKAFEDLGIQVSAEESLEFQRLYSENQKTIFVTETIRELLDRCLQKQIPMGLITNGPTGHQWMKIQALGLTRWIPGERIIVSAECGFTKPHREIFLFAEKKLSLKREDSFFVGDHYINDILGAKNAGWHTVWLNKKHQKLAPGDYHPDLTAETEEELLQCLTKYFGI